ncbi:MAG TPA: [Fe-Fe] hydrogenase large subunit C-terminal domain-containing protein [Salinivirgaceae bacterium]|nr:[Fe-Fe] hydrogenase large subunit C-terminal domain-containing protein [Salinivirgaceae bacterium]
MEVVKVRPERCKLCYACIRVCPAYAIKANDKTAQIIPERCIGCGSCLSVCPYYAIKDLDAKREVKNLIKSGAKVAAICGPSISGEFHDITDYTNFVGMIKALGFTYVCEVSFGADLIAMKYRELFENFKGKYFITSNCPAVVNYVELYHPLLIENMAPLVSPMVASAMVVHKKYGTDVKVVFIGPCTAAKGEAMRYEGDKRVDIVLTYRELRQMFAEVGITENNVEFSDFDPPFGGKGNLFPISRGMFQSVGINEDLLSGQLIAADGKANVLKALKEFEQFNLLKQHLDLFYCDGNCIMGPGTSPGGQKFLRRSLVIAYTKKRLATWSKEQWDQDIEEFIKLDFSRTFQNRDMRLSEPSEEQITEILLQMGKDSYDKQSACGACGYNSCRDLAVAVANGLATIDMCHTYMVQSKNKYERRLRAANEKLDNTLKSLNEAEQQTRREREAFEEARKITSGLLNKLPTGVVIVDENLKIVQSNQSFINLLGQDAADIAEIVPGLIGADLKALLPQHVYNFFNYVIENNVAVQNKDIHLGEGLLNISIFPITPGKIVGAIIRDMYVPEVRKEEVINRVNEVIDKNLKLIQEIAFLLGEGASETERMLNSIIESYKDTKKQE